MPELPEVESVRSQLLPWLPGRTIAAARLSDAPPGPKYALLDRADGQRITDVRRRGKFLILPLTQPHRRGDGDELIIHLGMTGVLTHRRPAHHLRVVVSLEPAPGDRAPWGDTLYFKDTRRFGRFTLAPGGDRSALPTLHAMGPEPLDGAFTADVFAHALGRSRQPIKTYLLSQRPVAGLGNIYVDEALWRARLHPRHPSHGISRVKTNRLHQAIITVLGDAVASGGTTLADYRKPDGTTGSYQSRLQAYGRAGQPCPRCQTPMSGIVVGQRGTTFCPRCQRV